MTCFVLPGRSRTRGFTLIELMVTVAVVAILAMVAYPSFTGLMNAQRLSAGTNELIAGLQIAKAEAIRRNARVVLCRSTNGTTCAGGAAGTVWTGWVILADGSDADSVPEEHVRTGTIPPSIELRSSAAIADSQILFRADGLARAGTAADAALLDGAVGVCIANKQPAENARIVNIEAGSRITTARSGTGAGTCATPANP